MSRHGTTRRRKPNAANWPTRDSLIPVRVSSLRLVRTRSEMWLFVGFRLNIYEIHSNNTPVSFFLTWNTKYAARTTRDAQLEGREVSY